MMADLPRERELFLKLRNDLKRINKDCPTFTAWIEQSFGETVDVVGDLSGNMLEKQSGALQDLKTILRSIQNPPTVEEFLANPPNVGPEPV